MSRTPATLPAGTRITDYISLGVVTKAVPWRGDQGGALAYR